MASHRYEIDAALSPGCERVIGGSTLLVRVRLFDGPGVVNALTGEPAGGEDVYSDLRPREARALAFELLCLAEHAERITEQAGGWQR